MNYIDKVLANLMEKLADIEHQRWADWQQHLHDRCECLEIKGEKNLLINTEDYKRWDMQIHTDYKDLSEEEKESDRKQVRRYLPLLKQSLLTLQEQHKKELVKALTEAIGEKDKPHTLSSENSYEYMKWSDGYNAHREHVKKVLDKYN